MGKYLIQIENSTGKLIKSGDCSKLTQEEINFYEQKAIEAGRTQKIIIDDELFKDMCDARDKPLKDLKESKNGGVISIDEVKALTHTNFTINETTIDWEGKPEKNYIEQ